MSFSNPTEVWANGPKWRMVTAYPNRHTGTISIQYSYGHYEEDVSHYLKMFGGSLSFAMDAAVGMGSERWYHDLWKAEAKSRLTTISASATRAGFTKLGTY